MNIYPIGRTARICLLAAVAGLCTLVNQAALAQTANFPPDGPKLPKWSDLPDWSGLWERGGDLVWDDRLPNTPGEPQVPPYNEQYMKEYQARRAEMRADALAGRPRNFRGGGLYASMPAMMIMLFPMDIQINPREVVIMTSNGGVREIYTDGRKHPVDGLPSTKGHSIGHWEGKTLVVDTNSFRDDTRFPGGGAHSDAMHISERISSPDGHALKDEITVDDPKAFTKPWTTEKTYYRRPDWEQVEYDPEENTRDFAKGPAGDSPAGRPGAAAAPGPAQAALGGGGGPGGAGRGPAPRIERDDDKPYTGSDAESLQKATAFAVGNLAWETVKIVNVERSATDVKWVGTTRSARWRCTAAADATKPFCESGLAPAGRPAAEAPAGAAANGTPPVAPAAEGRLVRNRISVDGRDRSYYYYVSSKVDRKGFNSIVYALHDNGQTAEEFAEQSGWKKVAEENGFVVVFPEVAEGTTPENTWAPNSGAEDHYLNAVYDDASTHMLLPGAAPQNAGGRNGADAGGPPREEGAPAGGGRGGDAAGAGRGREGANAANAEGGEGNNRRGDGRPPRVMTWFPYQYLTGVGAGGRVAQEFAINHPGIYAAVATLDAAPFRAAYAKGDESAQGYFQQMRIRNNAPPVWKQLKKDVPVAMWLFNSHEPNAAVSRLADYWKHTDRVSGGGAKTSIAGFETTVYGNPASAAQQVRLSTVPGSAQFDDAMASAIWGDFFAHVARWTSSPNGDLGPILTQAEVNSAFDVRSIDVDGKPYKYYLKRPASFRKGQALPLVVSAHGFGFPAWRYLSQIRMHEVGEKEGFLTAYIEGPQPGWDFTSPDSADARFVEKVIADVEANDGADPRRVYMQGFSLGSGLSYMMGITHPQLFAAVSPNSGIGPMSKDVEARVAEIKGKSDIRIPMLMVYGNVDSGGSVDGKIPAQGVIRGAFDELKTYNHISTQDRTQLLDSDRAVPYEVLVPGARLEQVGIDKRYPKGRFGVSRYMSTDAKPLNLFSFVWVEDMAHGGEAREAGLEWDYFKQWQRNADGTLTHVGPQP